MKASYLIEAKVGVQLNARDMLLLTLGQRAALSDGHVKKMEVDAVSDARSMEAGQGLLSRLKGVIARG